MANKKRLQKTKPVSALPVIQPNVAGIDLGSSMHMVCGPAKANGEREVRKFGTTTLQLDKLVDWLLELGVESVAMESTSVYWIPLYELLESRGIEVLLVNARQLGNVPGRKTDVLDCQWIQLLHSCGLLRGSFRPNEAICYLRALKRQSANLMAERTKAVQWMQKALDQMNVQVHRAVTDLTGKTGMSIVRAIVSGERDPLKLAQYRDQRCKKSIAQIAEYLTGTWREEHLFNLKHAVMFYDYIEATIESYDEQLRKAIVALQPKERKSERVPPHQNPTKEKTLERNGDGEMRTELWRLTGVDITRIDGIATETALIVVTEIGLDLSTFPSEQNFVSWLRLSPKYGVSAGKPLKKKNKGMGATRISIALRMAAQSLRNSKTALGAYFRRISRRKDYSVAVFATARKLATLVFRMLRYGQDYTDIGEQAYEKQFLDRRLAALKVSAKSMGYDIIPTENTSS
jgi:transposase